MQKMTNNDAQLADALNLIYKDHDINKGMDKLKQLADSGESHAQYELGLLLERNNQYKESISYYNLAINNGNLNAAYNLGLMYFHGKGCEINLDKCIELWTKAANVNHLSAIHNLSGIYLGIFVEESSRYVNIELGIDLCKRAVEMGHIGAKANLGWYYVRISDYINAKKYLLEAAKAGNITAQTWLGLLYTEDGFKEKSYSEAAKWFTAAALHDDVNAIHYLGVCYFNGRGVKKNVLRARDLWVRASLQGNKHSQSACFGMPGVYKLFEKGVAPVYMIIQMYEECDEDLKEE